MYTLILITSVLVIFVVITPMLSFSYMDGIDAVDVAALVVTYTLSNIDVVIAYESLKCLI